MDIFTIFSKERKTKIAWFTKIVFFFIFLFLRFQKHNSYAVHYYAIFVFVFVFSIIIHNWLLISVFWMMLVVTVVVVVVDHQSIIWSKSKWKKNWWEIISNYIKSFFFHFHSPFEACLFIHSFIHFLFTHWSPMFIIGGDYMFSCWNLFILIIGKRKKTNLFFACLLVYLLVYIDCDLMQFIHWNLSVSGFKNFTFLLNVKWKFLFSIFDN